VGPGRLSGRAENLEGSILRPCACVKDMAILFHVFFIFSPIDSLVGIFIWILEVTGDMFSPVHNPKIQKKKND
jgi:hypothetical protein